jgi:hypothetical protein
VAGVSWDYDKYWWAVPIVEGELGPTSEAEPCRRSSGKVPDTCVDAAVLFGIRLRPTPHAFSGVRPFANILLGEYWKGSGRDDEEFVSSHFAMQVGGGIELRWPRSFHGMRVSADVRHVFAGNRDRTQLRFVRTYVIGPRRFIRPTKA